MALKAIRRSFFPFSFIEIDNSGVCTFLKKQFRQIEADIILIMLKFVSQLNLRNLVYVFKVSSILLLLLTDFTPHGPPFDVFGMAFPKRKLYVLTFNKQKHRRQTGTFGQIKNQKVEVLVIFRNNSVLNLSVIREDRFHEKQLYCHSVNYALV